MELARSGGGNAGSGVLEVGAGSEGEGGGSVLDGEDDGSSEDDGSGEGDGSDEGDSPDEGDGSDEDDGSDDGGEDPGGDEVSELDGEGVGVGDSDGDGVPEAGSGRVIATPLTLAERIPSEGWSKICTSSPDSMKGVGRQGNVTKDHGFTY